ncbi:MAG: ABC transporter permease subunit [Stellaceae bacterium]
MSEPRVGTRLIAIAFAAATFVAAVSLAHAEAASSDPASILSLVLKWLPLIFSGFLLNLLVSVLSMAIGTAAGVPLGLAQIARNRVIRGCATAATQFTRNAPWLVLLFLTMFLLPFQFRVFGQAIPFPAWIKAVIGLAIPVMGNVSEIVRGGVLSIPRAQWESAESLAFSPAQTVFKIILPQALKRMLPPWMNLYAILAMATPLIAIVGIQDGLTDVRGALVAENRTDLLLPLYATLLAMFFIYCYPIAMATRVLERRAEVKF